MLFLSVMDLSLFLTHDCNLRCTYCYGGKKFKKEMPLSVAKKSFEFVQPFLEEKKNKKLFEPVCHVGFFGGEPFAAFELLKTCTSLAKELLSSPQFTLTTNGTFLKEKTISFLKENEFSVAVSIDGCREAHEATRPFASGKSSFDKVLVGLESLITSKLGCETISVIDPANVAFLGDSVKFLAEQGVRNISLNPNFDAYWKDADLEVWKQGLTDVAAFYTDSFRKGRNVDVNVFDEKITTWVKGGFGSEDYCKFGEGTIAVAPSGNIYPCERLVGDDRNPEFCIGTIFEGFNSRRDELVCLTKEKNETCQSCALEARCMNWCPCQNLASSGSINHPGSLVCWHDQVLIELADEVASTLYAEKNPLFISRFY